jgi:Flp pilus assembly protein TadG
VKRPPLRRRCAGDRGSYSLEVAVLTPALISLLLLMVAFGRITDAQGAVDSAARAAARAASLERSAGSAQSEAQQAASLSLSRDGVNCQASSVTVDTSGYALTVGQEASVTATIDCTANLSDIGLPGLPGAKTLNASWTSPIDTYRTRS